MQKHLKTLVLGALPFLAASLIAGCASTPTAPRHAQVTDEVSAEASVLGVNKASRDITIQRPDGEILVIVAGPAVRNFDQIKAGDKVVAQYTVSLAARVLAAGEPDTAPVAGLAAGRAETGQMPAGAIGAGVALTVKVQSVDKAQHIVTFTGPDGRMHVMRAQRDEGKEFVDGLKSGDRVELIYKEAVAISVSAK